MIKGITVTLYERTQTGVDEFGIAEYSETPVEVDGILVAPTADDAIVTDLQLYGTQMIVLEMKELSSWLRWHQGERLLFLSAPLLLSSDRKSVV